MKTYVVHHDPCPDGMAAAWVARKALSELRVKEVEFIPMSYTDTLPQLESGSDVYFLDFTLKRAAMIELAREMSQVVILDHHKSAEADLAGLSHDAPNVFVVFDMNKSGAQIAWEYFFPEQTEPLVITHIADRDIWTWRLQNTRAITEAVMSYPYDLDVYDSLISTPLHYPVLLNEGNALLRLKDKQIAALVKEARPATFQVGEGKFDRATVPVVNAPYFLATDVAHALLQRYPQAPFTAAYREMGDGRRDWSLRSEDRRLDVSEIATLNGGGGHRNAAGMSERIDEPKITIHGVTYENLIAQLNQAA
jgi:oligoribonuclease NrnB/cAMP/cGMP phosphodiesterase (DHH superfamily)